MKLVTTEFKSGGLHEKHVEATWNLGNHLSICLQTRGNPEKPAKPRKTWETKKNLRNQEKPVKPRKTWETKKNLKNQEKYGQPRKPESQGNLRNQEKPELGLWLNKVNDIKL